MENENSKKKTTAPDTSVGADDGQPLHNSTENSISAFDEEINGDFQNSTESLDEIYRRIQRLTDPHYLRTISMTELYQTAYQSRPPIIDGLLYAGAYILAGAPKIGKSFLVAQIAYHVSTGEALWGCEVHPGTVLYLALEDDFQRIQSRMFMMYGVNDTDRLHFATAAGKIGNGLEEQLENFVREHPDTRLIIIDTMQKIREVGGEAYSYASDYEIIGRLKQFADKHCICVLTVHHTRKQPAGDSFEMISGTTGLLGCAVRCSCRRKSAQRWRQPSTWWDATSRIRFSISKRMLTPKSGILKKWRMSCTESRPIMFWKPLPSWCPQINRYGQARHPSLPIPSMSVWRQTP